jgi:XTP/dITP diphosphohydrolase
MFDRIVIATQNPAKRERYAKILQSFARHVVSLKDLGNIEKPEESGETAEANALIKAKYYASRTGLPVVSEDEALYVDFLAEADQPGVHVRRIDRVEEVDDDALLAHWERRLTDVPSERRTGRWHFAYAVVLPDGRSSVASLERRIRFYAPSSPVRISGWPMSSLQGPIEFAKPHSEMSEEEKARANAEVDSMIGEAIAPLFSPL